MEVFTIQADPVHPYILRAQWRVRNEGGGEATAWLELGPWAQAQGEPQVVPPGGEAVLYLEDGPAIYGAVGEYNRVLKAVSPEGVFAQFPFVIKAV